MKNTMIIILLISSFNSMAGAQFLTVGNDNACDHSDIQMAIDSGLSNTIRIASNKIYFENITVDDRNLVMTGGYADCSAAGSNITDLSSAIIDGGNSGTTILVTGNSQTRDVEIRNLLIGNGDVGLGSTADVNLTLDNAYLINNNNFGVLLLGGDQNVSFNDVTVTSNQGSGVACSGSEISVIITGDSHISENESINNGGGLIIADSCTANVHAPTVINNNRAVSHGGGISVSNGALVNLNGVELLENEADSDGNDTGDGGGLYVADALSIVNAVNVDFTTNSAFSGGAVAANDGGTFTSYAANTQNNPCTTPGQCSSFDGNTAREFGGVFHATNDGQIKVLHANIKNNGLFGHGLIGHAAIDGLIKIEGSMIVNNGGEDLPGSSLFFVNGISGDNEASINLNHVTIADNELAESVIRNFFGSFSMDASIVQEEVNVSDAVAPVTHTFECAIVHETSSFSAGGTVTIDDPDFINPGSNFHIKPTSPAIDYCYDAEPLTVELGYDIDFENRNYDDPNVSDLHGQFDIGADEYRWDNDLIFMNGFEQL